VRPEAARPGDEAFWRGPERLVEPMAFSSTRYRGTNVVSVTASPDISGTLNAFT
jgi:hypothetical protein